MTAALLVLLVLPVDPRGAASAPGERLTMFEIAADAPTSRAHRGADEVPPAAPVPPASSGVGDRGSLPQPAASSSAVPPPGDGGMLATGRGDLPAFATGTVQSEYQDVVRTHVIRFGYYPTASQGDLRGLVRVGIELARDGRVLSAWIEQSSGREAVDDAALLMVRRAEPMPPIPVTLPGELTLTFPLEFVPSRAAPFGGARAIRVGYAEPVGLPGPGR